MNYEEMLDEAFENLPESVKNIERFEIPKVRGHIQGNKTIINNFNQISTTLRRDPNHLSKFLSKELATPVEIKKTALIIGTKISASKINEKIEKYVKKYVICGECNRPDTKIIKEGDVLFLKCQACGARKPIK